MSFKTQIATDLDVFLDTDEFAQEITYAGGTVNAIVILDDLTPELGAASNQGLIYIKISDLSSAPSYRDSVVTDGATWKVFQDESDAAYYVSEGMYVVNIYKDERVRIR